MQNTPIAPSFTDRDPVELRLGLALDQPGDDIAAVNGLVISQSFSISENHWDNIFNVAFSGEDHQRSGVELTFDATDWTRTPSLHPDDGRTPIHESQQGISDMTFVTGRLAAQQRQTPPGEDDVRLRIDLPDPLPGPTQPVSGHGNARNNTVTLNSQDNAFHARGGKDTVFGKGGDDDLKGGIGDDRLFGGDGNDRLWGQMDNDHMWGNRGNDALYGGGLLDWLQGGPGADQLFGGAGDDNLKGGRGDDVLFGGPGSDWAEGGKGSDVFVFRAGDGDLFVADYEKGRDTIALDAELAAGFDTIEDLLATGEFNRTGVKFYLEFENGDSLVLRSLSNKTIETLAEDFVLF